MMDDRLNKAIELFDQYNLQDPTTVIWNKETFPSEYFYALQLHQWVLKLNPHASEALLLASRSQHIGRWEIPRNSYEAGRIGYLKWRKDLSAYHAQKAAHNLEQAGYDDQISERVQAIIQKRNLKNDEEVQLMENALCLIFLEFQFETFIQEHDDQKIITIIQKTWNKMTKPGHDAALTLNYSERGRGLILQALAG